MFDQQIIQMAIIVLVGIAAFLLLEFGYLAISNRSSYKGRVNRRLKVFEDAESQQDVLVILRRERGLSDEGRYRLPLIWFNRLLMQSGLRGGAGKLAVIVAPLALAAFVGAYVFSGSAPLAALAALGAAGLLPLLILSYLRRKRRRKFEEFLPDAVDIMVRGLRAGHPLPIAISMVGRELPDPIGTEFGMTSDEMTYGLDLEAAMNNMATRVGQDDLALLVVAISIQAKTGGNLAEILHNLANVLRARFKMRRRIKAVSAEGRMSAIGLSALPFLVFAIINVVVPNFYGSIWNEPIVWNVLGFAMGLMTVGNLIMFRMVNFRI